MQDGAAGFQSWFDEAGGEWTAAAAVAEPLRRALEALIVADRRGAPMRPIKLSARREVFGLDARGLPALLLKRYPPRRGAIGRLRDRAGVRAAAEFARAGAFLRAALPAPEALAWRSPPRSQPAAPSWFVGVRLLGAVPLGSWLESRFTPGDGAAIKFEVVRRALAQVAAMHEAGLWHRDCHGGNLLLRDAEGPAATLWFIDLHGVADLGAVPASSRSEDLADLLHSLRYSCSAAELDELAAVGAEGAPPEDLVRRRLAVRRERHARSRGARAFATSSRYASARLADGSVVHHDRALGVHDVEDLIVRHRAALAADDALVLRRGRRSLLTRLPHPSGAIVVKESPGPGGAARARCAFSNGVLAVARDLPVATPLGVVVSPAGGGFSIARAIDDQLPLHLAAHEALGARSPERVAAASAAVGRLFLALHSARFVHPDLSLKNLLLDEGRGASRVTLLDLDAARRGARWTTRRLVRALAQLGDVPSGVVSKTDRLRFVSRIVRDAARPESVDRLLRQSAAWLARRRRIAATPPSLRSSSPVSLHLFGNWKWTGPAEPAVAIAHAFAPEARLLLGAGPAGATDQQLVPHARARAIESRVEMALRKHWNPLLTGGGAAAVERECRARPAALLVTHLDADQAAAERARAALEPRPAVLRCVHDAGPRGAFTRRLLRSADLLVTPTRGLARALEEELGLQVHAVGVLETSVDRARFSFSAERRERGRARLGLTATEPVFGIVARIQTHRRFELLIEAWRILAAQGNPPQLLIFGRGTEEEALVHEPIRRLGLARCVRVPGYQEGDAFVESLAACDGGLFLVPGTDVSCRAVREWMAMGRAVVALRRSPLPELIDDAVDGWLVDETAEALAARVRQIADHRTLAAAGARAAEKAARRFDPAPTAAIARLFGRMALLARPGAAARVACEAAVLSAVRPGRIDAALEVARRDGFTIDQVLAFDPSRSRDAMIDLVTLARIVRPRMLAVEHDPEWDSTAHAAFRRLAPEVVVLETPRG